MYSELPEQLIPKTMKADDLELLEGAGGVVDNSRKAFKYHIGSPHLQYREVAKNMELCAENINEYFSEPDLVSKFGLTTQILARPGFCRTTNTWKLYLKKENPGYVAPCKPSVLGILLAEMDDIQQFIDNTFEKIDDALQHSTPLYKPWDASKLERPKDLSFWQADEVYYTESASTRVRIQWSHGNIYITHINSIKNPTQNFPNYFGPRLALSRREVHKLLKIYHEIRTKLGPTEELD